jgi:hypothetical protein
MGPGAWLFVAACATLSLLCAAAVLAHSYHDTLLQRVALAGLSIGALAMAWHAAGGTCDINDADVLFAGSAALFAIETARKLAWRRHRGRWWHDGR